MPPQLKTPRLLRTLLSSLLTAMGRVARLLVAVTGTASLITAHHPAMHPTSSQNKTLVVMGNVVLPATKSSAAIITETKSTPLLPAVAACEGDSHVEELSLRLLRPLRWQLIGEGFRNFFFFSLLLCYNWFYLIFST